MIQFDFVTGGLRELAIASTQKEVELLIQKGFKVYFSPEDGRESGMNESVYVLGILVDE